jgi:hypothetical protein
MQVDSLLTPAGHVERVAIDLYVRHKLDEWQSSVVQAHVHECPDCERGMVNGMLSLLTDIKSEDNDSRDRRGETRVQSGQEGLLQTVCPMSFDRLPVQISDVSKDGLGLRMASSLAPRTIVQVHVGTQTSVGTVRSCRATADGQFHVGIQVQTGQASKRH